MSFGKGVAEISKVSQFTRRGSGRSDNNAGEITSSWREEPGQYLAVQQDATLAGASWRLTISTPRRTSRKSAHSSRQYLCVSKTHSLILERFLFNECEALLSPFQNSCAWGSARTLSKRSLALPGLVAYWPDILPSRVLRPAAVRAGIEKLIGWYTFGHTFSTIPVANGENLNVVQELMRHANCRTTLEIYPKLEFRQSARRKAGVWE